MKIGLFDDSSQTIGPKGLKFSGFDKGYPGVIIKKFGEDMSKTMPVGVTTLCLTKTPHLQHTTIVETHRLEILC